MRLSSAYIGYFISYVLCSHIFLYRQIVSSSITSQNPRSGNWWLRMMNVEIGYWPSELFTALRKSARTVVWGGHVISPSTAPGTEHAKTQMGSGRFPDEGFGRSCFFRDLWYTTADRPTSPRLVDPRHLHRFATRPQCYDVIVAEDDEWGVHIYFGGPGYSNRCRYNWKWCLGCNKAIMDIQVRDAQMAKCEVVSKSPLVRFSSVAKTSIREEENGPVRI